MAVHCADAERGILIKKELNKVQQRLLRPSDVPVRQPTDQLGAVVDKGELVRFWDEKVKGQGHSETKYGQKCIFLAKATRWLTVCYRRSSSFPLCILVNNDVRQCQFFRPITVHDLAVSFQLNLFCKYISICCIVHIRFFVCVLYPVSGEKLN